MNYLVLHIDVEFIAGIVYTNGNVYPVTNGKEELLWLYFFNNPHQHRISFGKENRTHFNNGGLNYYGKFFELIETEQEKFTVRGIEKNAIELLEYSGLLKTLKEKYSSITHEQPDNIPTLITFSLSISELAKQKTIDYFKNQGFQIHSYTIPLSELVCYYPFSKKDFIPNSNTVLLLAATNTSLHLMKLVFTDNYFMIDGKVKTYEGKGMDPRKRALVRFVVNEVNHATGALSSDKEKEAECEKMEPKAEEWLKRIDAQSYSTPFRIVESFSKMPNAKKEVFARKDNIESDTGHYIQELMDIFDAFKSDNVRGDVAAIFLLGDCFQNSLVKDRFNKLIHNEKLFVYANKDIQDILSIYPKIDITRYADEEKRIKARANAEQRQQDELRALEDKQRKEKEAEEKRVAKAKKEEENRKEAKQFFERAVGLDKEGKLQDALTNVENAIEKDADNPEYSRLKTVIKDKLGELKIRTEQYKSLLNRAEKSVQSGDFENALNIYELAKDIFDNAEIRNTILELKNKIKQREKLKKTISQLFENAEALFNQGKLSEAKGTFKQLLAIDPEHKEAKKILKAIEKTLQEIEIKYRILVKEADKHLNESRFDAATIAYKEALKIKPNDEYCLGQLKVVADKKASIKPPPPPPSVISKPVSAKPITAAPPVAPPPPPIPVKPKPAANSGTNGNKPPPPPIPSPTNVPKKSGGGSGVPPPPPPNKKK
jgi:tetratricopeptide (TPR) repeat protein